MNMISTGAFLTEMDSSSKKDELVSKLMPLGKKEFESGTGGRNFIDGPVIM